jgi:hypothetical protein
MGGLTLRQNNWLTLINSYRICKYDSNLYLFLFKSVRSYTRYCLLLLNFNLNIVNQITIGKSPRCLAANRSNVFCLNSDSRSILVYDQFLTSQTSKFDLDDQNISLIKFNQMDVNDENLLLLRTGELLILSVNNGQTLKRLDLTASKFKCIGNGFLLLNVWHESKLAIYDIEKEVVYREKHYDRKINLVLEDQLKEVALFLSEDLKIYF